MTVLSVRYSDGVIRVGRRPEHPERTAVVEARGAVLLFDELGDASHPAAEVFDPDLAIDWLWEVYGAEAAAAIAGAQVTQDVTIQASDGSSVLARLRRLAAAEWATTWWPASSLVGIPSLPPALLAAERAVETFAVEHLLEDEGSVEGALELIQLDQLDLAADDPVVGESVVAARDLLTRLIADYGVRPVVSAQPPREGREWTLAAGRHHTGEEALLRGTSPVDWSLVAPGQVDAAGRAHWTLSRRAGESILSVSVPAGEAPATPLFARLHDAEVPLGRETGSPEYTGWAAVGSRMLLSRPSERHIQVYSPDVTTEPTPVHPELLQRQAAVIDHARGRLAAPDSLLAQRWAGRNGAR